MNIKFYLLAGLAFCTSTALYAQTNSVIRGKVVNEHNKPLSAITISAAGVTVKTKADGSFEIPTQQEGAVYVRISGIGYRPVGMNKLMENGDLDLKSILLVSNNHDLEEVEVFGNRNRQPKGLEMITRMPLKPSDQIQSISVISSKVIADQGALTLTDAIRNVPGVSLFGSYGGVRESMSIRGFRGVPVLKNGVRMDSQFQTASAIVDMQGVETIQVIKGSAAITQGVITDIGNAGGVINLTTKTPEFVDGGQVDIRIGAWGQVRPTFDYQAVLDNKNTVAMRINGAYERGNSYRTIVNNNRVYINPSFAWRPNEQTTVTFEADYLQENRTPHGDAVNLGAADVNKLYLIPYDQFLGFSDDKVNNVMASYMFRVERKLTDKLKIRAALSSGSYMADNTSTGVGGAIQGDYNLRARTISRAVRDDKNTTAQFDFIGEDIKTGSLNHTFQVGFDYRIANSLNTPWGSSRLDTINVMQPYTNTITNPVAFAASANPTRAQYSTLGLMAQDVITFNKYLKAILGVRYTEIYNKIPNSSRTDVGSAWNPSLGVMVRPIKQVNIFGSYTTSTSLRNAAQELRSGERVGASTTNQFEAGIKSDWLNDRLRFNFTYFHINTANLTNSEYDPNTNTATGYVFQAGDLKRQGIEVELNGRVLENLQVMLGYAYLDARYENSPSYVNGSAPMNAPKHTANGWIQYTVNRSALKGLSIGFGAYYVGDRPVNEYSTRPDGHGTVPGVKPFDMPGYMTLNSQLGYTFGKLTARVFFNNIANKIGLNSYFRGGFINQTDPRNVAGQLSYRF